MPKTILLPLLADGEYHSGQELAGALGVSRTAVWKQLKRLEDLGIEVESVKGLGYRIPGGLDLLDEAGVTDLLRPAAGSLLGELRLLDSVDSTNAEILSSLEAGKAGRGLVCSAEQQTAGRGRRGRQWVSPFGRNIYLSLAWEFSQGAAVLEGLSLAVGVAVARSLARFDLPPVTLKWPNDILYDGRKLGGVLLEMTGDAAGQCQVVVGIGLNVRMPPAAADAIDQPWTDLETLSRGALPARNALLAAMLDELLPLVAGFEETGFEPWREAWCALDALSGAAVLMEGGAEKVAGTARGVNDRGALLLETTTGMRAIYGGEVSLRAQG